MLTNEDNTIQDCALPVHNLYSEMIKELEKHKLPVKSFSFNLKYYWVVVNYASGLRAALNNHTYISASESYIVGSLQGSSFKSKYTSENHEAIIKIIKNTEPMLTGISNFKSTAYLLELFNKKHLPSQKQGLFLEKLLLTKRHNLKINNPKSINQALGMIAISYLITQPLISGLELTNKRSLREKMKRISTSKATITVLSKSEKNPSKLKLLMQIRDLWDKYQD